LSAPRSPRDSRSILFVLGDPIARTDVPALCERLRIALEASDAAFVICDVCSLTSPDAVTIDALARLQLTARRLGCQLQLRHASPQLVALIAFMGLSGVVQLSAASRLRAETEERKERIGVEERVQRHDPAV
jgi:anti-anti-sigma regulatory factor